MIVVIRRTMSIVERGGRSTDQDRVGHEFLQTRRRLENVEQTVVAVVELSREIPWQWPVLMLRVGHTAKISDPTIRDLGQRGLTPVMLHAHDRFDHAASR